MANNFPFLISISKHLPSTTPKFSITSRGSRVFFSTAPHQHVQGDDAVAGATNNPDRPVKLTGADDRANPVNAGKETVDTAWDATKNTAQNIIDTNTAEAETNVVDTAEYRSSEDLKGQLGDGHDNRVKM